MSPTRVAFVRVHDLSLASLLPGFDKALAGVPTGEYAALRTMGGHDIAISLQSCRFPNGSVLHIFTWHYAEAARLLGEIGLGGDVLHEKRDAVPSWAPVYLAAAQVHATLALAAVTALSQPEVNTDGLVGQSGLVSEWYLEWLDVAG